MSGARSYSVSADFYLGVEGGVFLGVLIVALLAAAYFLRRGDELDNKK